MYSQELRGVCVCVYTHVCLYVCEHVHVCTLKHVYMGVSVYICVLARS